MGPITLAEVTEACRDKIDVLRHPRETRGRTAKKQNPLPDDESSSDKGQNQKEEDIVRDAAK